MRYGEGWALWAISLSILWAPLGMTFAEEKPAVLTGAEELAGVLLKDHPYLLEDAQRSALGDINRQLREAAGAQKKAADEEARQKSNSARATSERNLIDLLETLPALIRVSLIDGKAVLSAETPVALPGEAGALLLRIEAGRGEAKFVATGCVLTDLRENTVAIMLEMPSPGTTWALVGLANMPVGRTSLLVELKDQLGKKTRVPIDVQTPEPGRLKVTVLSADTGKPTPAMIRLVWNADGRDRKPSNAIEFGPQFDGQGQNTGRRNAVLPGALKGHYWCIPGPLDMVLPPGKWDIVVRRGLEHMVISDTFTVESGRTVERTFTPQPWVDMRKSGWYSGDDHVHCRILSQDDAKRLMAWVQAEDIHLANVVKMGDISRTYFEQRGFGKDYRVIDGDYILSPGQECPRTHNEIGHTLSMNINSMVRDTERYYLYDWVFDAVHAQGGLSGYAHVNSGIFHVHRDMSINIPKGKIDFTEILQFAQLGTKLYYEFLNTGFKVTASAGSDVPWGGTVGEVRVFTYVGQGGFSADAWFEALRKGRSFVTNGPMLEFTVDRALPGDELAVKENRKLRVHARAWGAAERLMPTKLDIIRHGDVVRNVESPDAKKAELSLDFELDAGTGFWIAAAAEATDGSKAHTTPIYVVREGLRFWKYDAVDDLIARRLASLEEVEKIVASATESNNRGSVEDNRTIKQLALQGPELLKRVAAARKIYEDLKQTAARERPLREASR